MQPPEVVYMGWTIFPVVLQESSGFASMAIIADRALDQRGSGVLGPFNTEAEAYQRAITFGKSEIERHRLMTLIC